MRVLSFLGFILALFAFVTSCGQSNYSNIISLDDPLYSTKLEANQPASTGVDFIDEIVLVEPSLIDQQDLSLQSSDHYWLALYNQPIGYIDATEMGSPFIGKDFLSDDQTLNDLGVSIINPIGITFASNFNDQPIERKIQAPVEPGESIIVASTSDSINDDLISDNESTSLNTGNASDECYLFDLDNVEYESIVNDGQEQEIEIHITKSGPYVDILRDLDAYKPPYINIVPVEGEVEIGSPEGETDENGFYRTTVKLLENLGSAELRIEARTSEPESSSSLLVNAISLEAKTEEDSPDDVEFIRIEDPCDEDDPDEDCNDEDLLDEYSENSFSDPNYRSFDGLYSWTDSEGDFILARSLDGQIEIQARQKRLETSGDSQNSGFIIRDGSDILEFNVVQANSAPELISLNGSLQDLGQSPLTLDSGVVVYYGFIRFPFYIVRTTTGDSFRVDVFPGSLNLSSRITSRGRYEGILGDANGNPDNDWTPRGGTPIKTGNYTIQEYGDFIESWRVSGGASLFGAPFGDYEVSITDWWNNSISEAEMKAGFQLYEQLFGQITDPYLAFRFAVDLAGGLPQVDLELLYQQVRQLQDPPPIPPIDADLNRNGIPDVQEPKLWVFDNLFNDEQQQCLEDAGLFDPDSGECKFESLICEEAGGYYNFDRQRCECGYTTRADEVQILDLETRQCFDAACLDQAIRIPDSVDLLSLVADHSEIAVVSAQGQLLRLSQPESCFTAEFENNDFFNQSELLASGLEQPWGIARFGNDFLITTQANGGRLERLSTAGQITTLATDLGAPHGIALDPAGNAVIATGDGRILQVDLTTGAVTELATGLDPLWDIIQVDGDFFVTTDREGGDVIQISAEGEVFPLSISSLNQPRGLSSDVNQNSKHYFSTYINDHFITYINDQGNERILLLIVNTETTPATVTVSNPLGGGPESEIKTKGVGISGKPFSRPVRLSGYGVFQIDKSGLISRKSLITGGT
ncbi:MAG: hypothetical protein HC921_12025 [Synechococcaceae cyanobacterium SM2_3_1]|nr:hypothetical protein [Synechococcaceae cyanobacterium SM2_3_1]